jgi:putative ABC transport system substrate-binding protein
MRVVGILMGPGGDSITRARVTAFQSALRELGWTEGRNVRFEVRWGDGDIDRTRTFASELVNLTPDVILAVSTPAIAVLKKATNSIPLVFAIVNDPVAQGLFRVLLIRAAISPASVSLISRCLAKHCSC